MQIGFAREFRGRLFPFAAIHIEGNGAAAALLVAALALVWGCSEAEPTREPEVAPIVEPTAVEIEIDPRTAKVGDAVYAIPRNPDGNCPDSAPAMEISVEVEAGEQSGVTVRMVKETCEIVIDEIEGGPQP